MNTIVMLFVIKTINALCKRVHFLNCDPDHCMDHNPDNFTPCKRGTGYMMTHPLAQFKEANQRYEDDGYKDHDPADDDGHLRVLLTLVRDLRVLHARENDDELQREICITCR